MLALVTIEVFTKAMLRSYTLPIEAAESRLLGHDPELKIPDFRETQRIIQFGRRSMAHAIPETLRVQGCKPNRTIGPYRLLRQSVEVASGWTLCERLSYCPAKNRRGDGHYRFKGLLLSEDENLHVYSGRTYDNSRAVSSNNADAWGNRLALVLKSDAESIPAPHVTECQSMQTISWDQDPHELDCQVGAVAGRLSLEDLFAGLIVVHHIKAPVVEVPVRT